MKSFFSITIFLLTALFLCKCKPPLYSTTSKTELGSLYNNGLPVKLDVISNFLADSIHKVLVTGLKRNKITILNDGEYKRKMDEGYKDVLESIYDSKNTSTSPDAIQNKLDGATPVLKQLLVFITVSPANEGFRIDSLRWTMYNFPGKIKSEKASIPDSVLKVNSFTGNLELFINTISQRKEK